jgi:hypothetical protein
MTLGFLAIFRRHDLVLDNDRIWDWNSKMPGPGQDAPTSPVLLMALFRNTGQANISHVVWKLIGVDLINSGVYPGMTWHVDSAEVKNTMNYGLSIAY